MPFNPLYRVGRVRDEVRQSLRRRQQRRWHDLGNVDPSVQLPLGSRLSPRVRIEAGTTFASPPNFSGTGAVSVGRHCAIGQEFCVITTNHAVDRVNMHYGVARAVGVPIPEVDAVTTIGHACWIGTRVTVLAGATIGDGAVIGAGSVVTGEIPPFSVAVGVPCRPIRQRFAGPIVEVLREIAWWEWSLDEMRRARELFELDLTAAEPDEVRRLADAARAGAR